MLSHHFVCIIFLLFVSLPAFSQSNDSAFKRKAEVWGYAFGDYYYKAHADKLERGVHQYWRIEEGRNAFQIRRIYLGGTYKIHPKFTAELLLAAEDNITDSHGITTGDLTKNDKLTFYIKLANIRWKNVWKGTDLIIGQVGTPAFSTMVDPVWSYRCIERTLTDMRRTPSYDLGIALQGKFDPGTDNFGYNIMVGNGTGARPENNKFKWFYGELYAKLLNKKLILDLYADYNRIDWQQGFHHSHNMVKGMVGYTTPVFTAGVEAFINFRQEDVVVTKNNFSDTADSRATGISLFARGSIRKDKLNYFIRLDHFNPDTKISAIKNETYTGLSASYEPNNNEYFFTAGLDFTPVKNVHFIPNVWFTKYVSKRADVTDNMKSGNDLVYRVTFFYQFGR